MSEENRKEGRKRREKDNGNMDRISEDKEKREGREERNKKDIWIE